jgi:hypothetical protein
MFRKSAHVLAATHFCRKPTQTNEVSFESIDSIKIVEVAGSKFEIMIVPVLYSRSTKYYWSTEYSIMTPSVPVPVPVERLQEATLL